MWQRYFLKEVFLKNLRELIAVWFIVPSDLRYDESHSPEEESLDGLDGRWARG